MWKRVGKGFPSFSAIHFAQVKRQQVVHLFVAFEKAFFVRMRVLPFGRGGAQTFHEGLDCVCVCGFDGGYCWDQMVSHWVQLLGDSNSGESFAGQGRAVTQVERS